MAQLNHYYSILLHTIYGKLRGKYAAKYEQKVWSKTCPRNAFLLKQTEFTESSLLTRSVWLCFWIKFHNLTLNMFGYLSWYLYYLFGKLVFLFLRNLVFLFLRMLRTLTRTKDTGGESSCCQNKLTNSIHIFHTTTRSFIRSKTWQRPPQMWASSFSTGCQVEHI